MRGFHGRVAQVLYLMTATGNKPFAFLRIIRMHSNSEHRHDEHVVLGIRELVDSGQAQRGISVFLETIPILFLKEAQLVGLFVPRFHLPDYPFWKVK